MREGWPSTLNLRAWQERGVARYNASDKENFMVAATPGAGKTMFGLRIAHLLLTDQTVKRVVVVCPSSHLCTQWADSAARVGIQLDPKWENGHGQEAPDFHGVAVTYQQVASQPTISAMNCRRADTLVILDEPHHMGEDRQWGEACLMAFENAVRRLLITGTPFRTDNSPIPYVTYGEDGLCRTDFAYSYADSLRDSVCRPVLFPLYDGDMKWFNHGQIMTANFGTALPKDQQAARLRTAVSGAGDFLPDLFGYADAKLTEVRNNGHPTAGGLIVASQQWQALRHKEMIESITGDQVWMAVSDDKDANNIIKRFAKDDCAVRWLVAVKMVSEGVDIPRLRVGIYSTNVTTELFFRQFVGRFVRMQPGMDDQTSYIYVPADEKLREFCEHIKEERQHQLEEELERWRRERGEGGAKTSDFRVVDTSPAKHDGNVYEGQLILRHELQQARFIKEAIGIKASEDDIALIIRHLQTSAPHNAAQPVKGIDTVQPLYENKNDKRRLLRRLVAEYHEKTGTAYRDINAALNSRVGIVSRDKATEEQLDRQIEYIGELLGYV